MPYSLSDYAQMIADDVRTSAYLEALERTVRPGCTVLDLGTGSGFFAFEACRLGARHVYAIDPAPAIHAAQAVARANGLDRRITFYPSLSTQVELPERVDVIVSDLRGVLPANSAHVPALRDARQRFLAPDGVLIPARDELFAAIVETEETYRARSAPWGPRAGDRDVSAICDLLLNQMIRERAPAAALLTEPVKWAAIDYHTAADARVRGGGRALATRSGVGHGLQVWFEATLFEDIGYSTSPMHPPTIYRCAFFPWRMPVRLSAGDAIQFDIRGDAVGEHYIWSWDTRVHAGGFDGPVTASFQQSTFFGLPLAANAARRRAPSFVPEANGNVALDVFVLQRFGRGESIAQIADASMKAFAARFTTRSEAVDHVTRLWARHDS